MKNNVINVMNKELARFFGNKRLLLSTIILPGVIIYFMYSFVGSIMVSDQNVDDIPPVVSVVNIPNSVKNIFESNEMSYEIIEPNDEILIKDKLESISNKSSELLLVFPEDFDVLVDEYSIESGIKAPNIKIFYNDTYDKSLQAFVNIKEILNSYEETLVNKFDINSVEETYNVASEKDSSGKLFSSLLPVLLITFIFTGCMALAPESIAGEKERGTIASLLVTPLSRSELVLGKLLAVSMVSTLSAASSTIGSLLALPNILESLSMELNIFYTINDFILLALIIISTVILFVSLLFILSTFANSIREAQNYANPLMIIVMVIGIINIYSGASSNPLFYLVPVYNSVGCMISILSFKIVPSFMFLTVFSNFVYSFLLVLILIKMFNSERIIFSR